MGKNIVDKYIEDVGKFIILISGLPGCGKQELGENIARDFKFKLLDTYNYYKDNYDNKIKLKDPETSEEVEFTNWYTDDAIDWEKLNDDINTHKKTGVVVIGISLNKIIGDYHIHLNISKQVSIEKTQKYIEDHKSQYPEEYEIIGTPMEKLKMNKLIYPYYLEVTKLAKINKYITVKEMTDDEIYDIAFDVLMQFVQKVVYKNVNVNVNVNQNKKKDENIQMELELLEVPRYNYDEDMDLMKKIEDSDDDTDTDSDTYTDIPTTDSDL
jgi:cytidylate kinase